MNTANIQCIIKIQQISASDRNGQIRYIISRSIKNVESRIARLQEQVLTPAGEGV